MPSGDLRADAVQELRWSMAGPGLTLDKLATMESVLALPVLAAAMRRSGDQPALVSAYDALCDASRRLGNALHPRVLRNALGVDYDGDAKDLTARRMEFIRRHNDAEQSGGNVIGESPRALYDIEARMLDALVTRLGAPVDQPAPPARAADPATGAQQYLDEGWEVEAFEVTCRFAGRAVRVAEVVDVVVARQDPLPSYDRMYYCTTDSGKPARLEVLEGGRVVNDRAMGRENFRVATIAFPEPLHVGQRHRVRCDVTYPSPSRNKESEPWLVVQIVRPYRRVVARLTFEPGCLPSQVWKVDGLVPEARGGDPDSSEQLSVDSFGFVEADFAEPRLSRCYGIAWRW